MVQPVVALESLRCSSGQEHRSSRCVVAIVEVESVWPCPSIELVDGQQSLGQCMLVEVGCGAADQPQEGYYDWQSDVVGEL